VVTATVTVNDYIAAHRLHHRRRSQVWYAICVAVFLVGVGLALSGVKFWGPVTIMGGIGGLLGQWWEDRVGLPTKVRKLNAQFKGAGDPSELTWDAEKLEGRHSRGHGTRRWTDYVRCKESEEVFLLYVTDQLWELIPKHCLSPEQISEIRTYASKAGAGEI
jgi:hypothetical protein